MISVLLPLVAIVGCYPNADEIRSQGKGGSLPGFQDASPTPVVDAPGVISIGDAPITVADLAGTPTDAPWTIEAVVSREDALAGPTDGAASDRGLPVADAADAIGTDLRQTLPDAADAVGTDVRQTPPDVADAVSADIRQMPDSAGVTSSLAADCAAWGKAICARFQACSPFLFDAQYPSLARCEERNLLLCSMTQTLPGASVPGTACAEAIYMMSCTDLNNQILPPECSPPGKLPTGSPCSNASQCESHSCSMAGSNCGKCVLRSPAGGSCVVEDDCEHGLYCFTPLSSGSSACVVPGTLGSACDSSHPCLSTLRCGSAGKCVQLGAKGSTCALLYDCNVYAGLLCNQNVLQCVPTYPSTSSCAVNSDNSFTYCSGASFCSSTNACRPPAEDGDGCSDTAGPKCLFPATCVDGRCVLQRTDTTCVAPSGLGPDNSAMLFGPALGDGTEATGALRRTVPVSLPSSDFQASPAYLGRSGSAEVGFTVIIQVTNLGAARRCYIKADTFDLEGPGGTALESAPGKYLSGSVGWDSTSGVSTGTCLGPGETGYLLGRSSSGNYASITGVSLTLSAAGTTFGLPKALVIPRIYDFDITGHGWEIEVMNVGSASADLSKGSHRAVYFASDGLPLTWGFLDVIDNPALAPSRTATLAPADVTDVGAGSSPQQYVIVDYAGASAH